MIHGVNNLLVCAHHSLQGSCVKVTAIIHGICTTIEMLWVACHFVLKWGTCYWFQVRILLQQLRYRPPFQTLNYQTGVALKHPGKEP
jgi:hypothetical protein